jgi:hypothetical protein
MKMFQQPVSPTAVRGRAEGAACPTAGRRHLPSRSAGSVTRSLGFDCSGATSKKRCRRCCVG